MAPTKMTKVRSSTLVKPAVHSATSMKKLEESLRRLGADETTVAVVTGRRKRRRSRLLPA